jgi:SAM-dependent methyltransferase
LQKIPMVGWLIARGNIAFPSNVEYGDVTKGLPLPNGICQGVYCSHVLEHLALNGFRRALLETFRVLRVGGVFRLVVPDLEFLTKEYMANELPNAAIEFMKSTLLGKEERDKSISVLLRDWLGNSRHLWMWDYKAMDRVTRRGRSRLGYAKEPTFHLK